MLRGDAAEEDTLMDGAPKDRDVERSDSLVGHKKDHEKLRRRTLAPSIAGFFMMGVSVVAHLISSSFVGPFVTCSQPPMMVGNADATWAIFISCRRCSL